MLYFGGDDYHPLQHTSYSNLTLQETADALGIPKSTANKRLRKSEELLKQSLTGGERA